MTCPALPLEHDQSYLTELWILSALGTSLLLTRLLIRLRTIGLGQFKRDDWMVVPILLLSATTDILAMYINNNGAVEFFTPDQLRVMEPCQIDKIEVGFKALLAVWYTVTALTWGYKCMMLCFLHRAMWNLGYNVWLRVVVAVTVLTYLAVLGAIMLTCRPVSEFWRVLPPQELDACRYSRQAFWTATVGTLLTDVMMICLPVPVIVRMRGPWVKQLPLALLLTTATLTTAAVVIRLVMTFGDLSVTQAMQWGARELLAMNCAVNLPFLTPLATNRFWRTDRRLHVKLWPRARHHKHADPPVRVGILPSEWPVSSDPRAERHGGGINLSLSAGSGRQHEANREYCVERGGGRTRPDVEKSSGKTVLEELEEQKKEY